MMDDRAYMRIALEEAQAAAAEMEVPVGAVLVYEDRILARDHNRMIQRKDALAHAEMLTLQAGALVHPFKWLLDATLYVTLEPCVMCAGALVLARVARVVYAAADPKAGGLGSTVDVFAEPHVNHRPQVTPGVLAEEASVLIKEFFRTLRER